MLRVCRRVQPFRPAHFLYRAFGLDSESIHAADVLQTKEGVVVKWGEGKQSIFHSAWLRANCPSTKHETGQGAGPAGGLCGLRARQLSLRAAAQGQELHVEWSDERKSQFAVDWLWQHRYSDDALHEDREQRKVTPWPHTSRLPEVQFDAVMESDRGLFEWLTNLVQHGVCMVKNTPLAADQVRLLAGRMAFIMPTLYGEVFDVRVEDRPVNVAYSNIELPLHTDLAYYESPPGVQMLHCLRFDDSVEGGESTFMDAHAAAERLRQLDPHAFSVLARVPATFQKDHMHRAVPAQMMYRRPHIQLGPFGNVLGVCWAPPFEGPLRAPEKDVVDYYRAYDLFARLFEGPEGDPHRIVLRLRPGDTATFNQRRVLHGRKAFRTTAPSSQRHLQGCYVNIDDFLNRYRALKRQLAPSQTGLQPAPCVGNGSQE